MHCSKILLVTALCLSPLAAQTQLVRGDIDQQRGTNRFFLDCTDSVELISNTVSLAALHTASQQQNFEYAMQVRLVSVGATTVLDVVSATQIPEMFQMGNLRFGRRETWEVFGTPGSFSVIYGSLRASAGYIPFGAAGTWVIGTPNVLINQGVIAANGQWRFDLQMPTLPALVGTEITSQAVLLDNAGTLTITNPDCKDVRAS